MIETYAQNCEDLVLDALLPIKKGFYVDVGANLPDTDSVTKIFYDKGWHGINIEPIPSLHKRLAKERPRDVNLQVGISNKAGKQKLREYQGNYHGWSTFSSNIKNLSSRQEKPHKDYIVSMRTLKDIFEEYKVKSIDFLKVDVEGFEYEVLVSNDWLRWRPKVIVIENTPGKWVELMKEQSYREVFFDGLNHYYVTQDNKIELTLREYNALIIAKLNEQSQQKQDKLEAEVQSATLLYKSIIEHPENHISNRSLAKAQIIQLKRRLHLGEHETR